MKRDAPLRIGYLISRYPAVSLTFILDEIVRLRRSGIELFVSSINSPDRDFDSLTDIERKEAQQTYYVKDHGFTGALKSFFLVAITRPLGLLKGLIYSIKLARFDFYKLYKNLMYLIEAMMVGIWMQERRLNHIHIHFASQAANVGLILSKIFPYSFSMTVHGPDEFYEVGYYNLSEKVASAKFICCIGYYARSQLMQLSPSDHWEKFEITPLGVDPQKFIPSPKGEIRPAVNILCVGRLVNTKGQHLLLCAAQVLEHSGRKLNVSFVGDGPEKENLLAKMGQMNLKKSVKFLGGLNHDQVVKELQKTDIFVLPSFAEGIPVALMEAMAMEIPCVSSNITGVPELIRDQVDGYLITSSNVDELTEAIRKLIDDSELRKKIGKSARNRIIEKYNIDKNINILLNVFSDRVL